MRFFFLLFAAACADYNLGANKGSAAEDTADGVDATDTAVDDTDTGAAENPAWYVVRADLTVLDGVASASAAVVSLDVVDADLERTDCVVPLSSDGVTGDESATVDGFVWWTIPVVPVETACAPLPDTLTVGIGAMHPDVRARLGSVGHDDIADSLYAAYLILDDAPAAFGYAGTASDLAGDDVAAWPAPDGLYRLAPLYLVPLPD